MSNQRYKEYCEARKASFCPRLRVNKFREWLLRDDNSEVKLSHVSYGMGSLSNESFPSEFPCRSSEVYPLVYLFSLQFRCKQIKLPFQ